MRRFWNYLGLALLAVLMVALAACGNQAKAPSTKNSQQMEQGKSDKTDLSKQNLSVSWKDAIQTFQKERPGADLTQLKLDRDDGRFIYSIDGEKGNMEYELEIDAKSREVLKNQKEKAEADDKSKYSKKIDIAKIITPKAAMKKALQEQKGQVQSYEIDTSYGKPMYEVNIQNGKSEYDVTLQAKDGKVVQVDND